MGRIEWVLSGGRPSPQNPRLGTAKENTAICRKTSPPVRILEARSKADRLFFFVASHHLLSFSEACLEGEGESRRRPPPQLYQREGLINRGASRSQVLVDDESCPIPQCITYMNAEKLPSARAVKCIFGTTTIRGTD